MQLCGFFENVAAVARFHFLHKNAVVETETQMFFFFYSFPSQAFHCLLISNPQPEGIKQAMQIINENVFYLLINPS